MSKPGSHDHAADVAARRALDAGLTRLGIAIVTHVASRGVNFQNDKEVQGEIKRPDGRRYHSESIGRKRRELIRGGFLDGKRFYPGQRPPGAKYRTGKGVVATSVLWEAFRVRTPTARGARTRERQAIRRELRRQSKPIPAGELAELAQSFIDEQLGTPPRPKPPPA